MCGGGGMQVFFVKKIIMVLLLVQNKIGVYFEFWDLRAMHTYFRN